MKITTLRFIVIFVIFASSYAGAYEEYCEFDEDKTVQVKPTEFDDGDVIISLLFPRTDRGILHRIDLRYDNPNKYGQHEIYTHLSFREELNGYNSTIHLSNGHKPLVLVAIYHFEGCYSNFHVFISNGKVTVK